MFRRAIFLTLFGCLTLLALSGRTQAEPLFVTDTNDGYLNLRSGPGIDYTIQQRIYGGIEVDGIGASGTWRRVALPDGHTGWASARYLANRYSPQRRYDAFVVRTNDGYLNLRTGPGTGSAIVQRLYAGQGIVYTNRQGSWRRVVLADGTIGWVAGNYLR